MRPHIPLLILPILHILLLLLLTNFTTPASAQSDNMFAYYLKNTNCRDHVPPGSDKTQAIPTTTNGQCVPVANALRGNFDVSISGKTYWTNGVTPALKACPTVDCDLHPDNECVELWGPQQWPAIAVCKTMVDKFYWAMGPQGFNLKERQVGDGEGYNGTYSNVTKNAVEWRAKKPI